MMIRQFGDEFRLFIRRTKKGYPATWECGGGMTNTGGATIVCNSDGSKKKPIYVRRRGPLACGEHGLFIIDVGDIIINANHHRMDFAIDVFKIAGGPIVDNYGEYMPLERLARYDYGEWDNDLVYEQYKDAIEAAKAKASCYHCRELHYALEEAQ